MLSIRCPICEEMVFLFLADWEDESNLWDLGEEKRVGLICLNCKAEFILQGHISQVVPE